MFVIYFMLWVIYNAGFTWEIGAFGIVIAAALLAFTCAFSDYSLQKEGKLYRNLFRLVRYVLYLVVEVIKSNLAVMHLILTQREEPEPILVTFKTELEHPATQALLANTITITPGTITVLLENGTYTVHCLDTDFAEGIDTSDFIHLIREIEDH